MSCRKIKTGGQGRGLELGQTDPPSWKVSHGNTWWVGFREGHLCQQFGKWVRLHEIPLFLYPLWKHGFSMSVIFAHRRTHSPKLFHINSCLTSAFNLSFPWKYLFWSAGMLFNKDPWKVRLVVSPQFPNCREPGAVLGITHRIAALAPVVCSLTRWPCCVSMGGGGACVLALLLINCVVTKATDLASNSSSVKMQAYSIVSTCRAAGPIQSHICESPCKTLCKPWFSTELKSHCDCCSGNSVNCLLSSIHCWHLLRKPPTLTRRCQEVTMMMLFCLSHYRVY
jgi:hypothetical protein